MMVAEGNEMDFQRARTREQVQARKDDILNACSTLFETNDYDEITLKRVAEMTSISRTSIYSYYSTKEDAFLDLLQREYVAWGEELSWAASEGKCTTREQFCALITDTFLARETMTKLLSVHLTEIEKNCSLQNLTAFKKEIRIVHKGLRECVRSAFPEMAEEDMRRFESYVFVILFGTYPQTHLTDKQVEAMHRAGITVTFTDPRTYCYDGLWLLSAKFASGNAQRPSMAGKAEK